MGPPPCWVTGGAVGGAEDPAAVTVGLADGDLAACDCVLDGETDADGSDARIGGAAPRGTARSRVHGSKGLDASGTGFIAESTTAARQDTKNTSHIAPSHGLGRGLPGAGLPPTSRSGLAFRVEITNRRPASHSG